MTQDEVLNLARQTDGQVTMWVNHSTIQKTTTFTFESPIDYRVSGDYPEMYHIKFLERFAKLVAAKEREACKALAKEYAAEYKEGGRLYPMLNGSITKTAASACDHIVYIIGERGQA